MKYEKERETIFDLEFIILEIYHSFVFWIITEFDLFCSIIDFDENWNMNDWCLLIILLLKYWCLSNNKDAKHPILSTFSLPQIYFDAMKMIWKIVVMMNIVIMVIKTSMIIIWDLPFSNKAKLLPLFIIFYCVTGDLNITLVV